MRPMKNLLYLLLVAALMTLTACGSDEPDEVVVEDDMTTEEVAVDPEPAPEIRAMADLQSASGSNITGTATFSAQPNGSVQVVARVEGAEPGMHGFHIHETGDCSAADFSSAGDHFNPTGMPHGGPTDADHHAGDLGNIEIGADGTGSLDLSSDMLSLANGADSIIGKAVILHSGEDDLESQPSGDAGDRLACGVIALAGDAVETTTTIDVGADEGTDSM